jgi:hypothetical protein
VLENQKINAVSQGLTLSSLWITFLISNDLIAALLISSVTRVLMVIYRFGRLRLQNVTFIRKSRLWNSYYEQCAFRLGQILLILTGATIVPFERMFFASKGEEITAQLLLMSSLSFAINGAIAAVFSGAFVDYLNGMTTGKVKDYFFCLLLSCGLTLVVFLFGILYLESLFGPLNGSNILLYAVLCAASGIFGLSSVGYYLHAASDNALNFGFGTAAISFSLFCIVMLNFSFTPLQYSVTKVLCSLAFISWIYAFNRRNNASRN